MYLNTLQVGEGLNSILEYVLLPVGTAIGPRGVGRSERWVKVANQMWERQADGVRRGRAIPASSFDLNGYNVVHTYPEGYTPAPAPALTLPSYKWRFRQAMLSSQARNGVSNSAVMTGLRLLGCDDAAMPIGAGLPILAQRDHNRVPSGSLIYTGNPEDVETFTVWRKTDRDAYARVLGPDNRTPEYSLWPYVTIAVFDVGTAAPLNYQPPAWLTSVTDEHGGLELFKARAWEVGMKVKAAQNWCGVVESTLAAVGVTADSAAAVPVGGVRAGDVVSATNAPRLPVGTLLRSDDGDMVRIFRRVENAPVRAGTRHVLSYRRGGTGPVSTQPNFAPEMRVLAMPIDISEGVDPMLPPFELELWRDEAWNALPPGSILTINGSFYMMHRDHRVRPCQRDVTGVVVATGQYGPRDFGLAEHSNMMRVVRLGEH